VWKPGIDVLESREAEELEVQVMATQRRYGASTSMARDVYTGIRGNGRSLKSWRCK
jgi:hypothetical protein